MCNTYSSSHLDQTHLRCHVHSRPAVFSPQAVTLVCWHGVKLSSWVALAGSNRLKLNPALLEETAKAAAIAAAEAAARAEAQRVEDTNYVKMMRQRIEQYQVHKASCDAYRMPLPKCKTFRSHCERHSPSAKCLGRVSMHPHHCVHGVLCCNRLGVVESANTKSLLRWLHTNDTCDDGLLTTSRCRVSIFLLLCIQCVIFDGAKCQRLVKQSRSPVSQAQLDERDAEIKALKADKQRVTEELEAVMAEPPAPANGTPGSGSAMQTTGTGAGTDEGIAARQTPEMTVGGDNTLQYVHCKCCVV